MNLITLGVDTMRSLYFTTCMLVLLSLITLVSLTSSEGRRVESLNVEVSITKRGIMHYNLTLFIPSKTSYLSLILPSEYERALLSVTSTKGVGVSIITRENLTLVLLKSSKPLATFNVNFTLILGPWIKPSEIALNIPITPLMPYGIHLLNFKMRFPDYVEPSDVQVISPSGAVVKSISNITHIIYLDENLPPNSKLYLKARVTMALTDTIFVETFRRKVEIHLGKAIFYDSFKLVNFGTTSISSIEVSLPNASKNIEVYGSVGPYFKGVHKQGGFWTSSENGKTIVHIELLHSIDKDEGIQVTVRYELDLSLLKEGSDYVIPLDHIIDAPIRYYELIIVLPEETQEYTLDPKPKIFMTSEEGYIAIYSIEGPIELTNTKVMLSFRTNLFLSYDRLIYLTSIVVVIITCIWYSAPLLRPRPVIERERERIMKLISLVNEVITTISRIRDLEELYSLGKIRHQAYKSQVDDLLERIDGYYKKLVEVIKDVEGIGRYSDVARQISDLILEAIRTSRSLTSLSEKYRKGEVTRRKYVRSRSLYRSVLERVSARISLLIEELERRSKQFKS